MNPADLTKRDSAEIYAEASERMLSYIVDCRFNEEKLTPFYLGMALEIAYYPHLRFWRDFDIATLFDAVTRHLPSWRSDIERSGTSAQRLQLDVEKLLRLNAFDESNAEMMLALPSDLRPTTASSAFDWICAALEKESLESEREFARQDRARCGQWALMTMNCLAQAQSGNLVERPGATFARIYRKHVLYPHN